MNKSLQLRRGTTAQHNTFTGLSGELSINVDDFTIILHDGATPGGIPFARRDYVDNALGLKANIANVYTKTESDNLLAGKLDTYDINTTEYVLGHTRGGQTVYGIEIDVGLLPNISTSVTAITGYNALYTYWVSSESYASDGTTTIMLPYPDISVNDMISVNLSAGNINITTASATWAAFSGKIVLNYTK